MFAWVEKENSGGRAFYQSMHFHVEEEIEDIFWHGHHLVELWSKVGERVATILISIPTVGTPGGFC